MTETLPAHAARPRALKPPRWRDGAILMALARALQAEHPCMGRLIDTAKLEAGLSDARALMEAGVVDPYRLAAAYASGLMRAKPLACGTAALALAAIYVMLRVQGLRLAVSEVEAVAVLRDLEQGLIGPAEIEAWTRRSAQPVG